MKTCETCRYWEPPALRKHYIGQCKLREPVVVDDVPRWVETTYAECCPEHTPREAEDE